MANLIRRFLKIPKFTDNASNQVARLTQRTAIGLVLFSVVFVIVISFIAPALVTRAAILGFTFTITSLGVIALIRAQRLRVASGLLITIMWLAITLGTITAGSISAPIVVGYLVVILA